MKLLTANLTIFKSVHRRCSQDANRAGIFSPFLAVIFVIFLDIISAILAGVILSGQFLDLPRILRGICSYSEHIPRYRIFLQELQELQDIPKSRDHVCLAVRAASTNTMRWPAELLT